jgi:hypothetical protein
MRANARLIKITNDPVQADSARRAHQVVLAAHVIDELLLADPAASPADSRLPREPALDGSACRVHNVTRRATYLQATARLQIAYGSRSRAAPDCGLTPARSVLDQLQASEGKRLLIRGRAARRRARRTTGNVSSDPITAAPCLRSLTPETDTNHHGHQRADANPDKLRKPGQRQRQTTWPDMAPTARHVTAMQSPSFGPAEVGWDEGRLTGNVFCVRGARTAWSGTWLACGRDEAGPPRPAPSAL